MSSIDKSAAACAPSRAAYFTNKEQTIITNKYEELREIVQDKSNAVAASKHRKDCWQKADCVKLQYRSNLKLKHVWPPKSSLFDLCERSIPSSSAIHFLSLGLVGRGVLQHDTVARPWAQAMQCGHGLQPRKHSSLQSFSNNCGCLWTKLLHSHKVCKVMVTFPVLLSIVLHRKQRFTMT